MIFFIPWVVFLLTVILAVPIASMMEKRGMQAAYDGGYDAEAGYDEAGGLSDGDEELEPLDDGAGMEEGTIEPQQDADDPFGNGAPDDFSAFDEEFK